MPLSPGTRIGPYEILSLLGAGGMGEVYRARDAKLSRDVALKVLPEIFASDAERLGRFTREAQTLAALNHPNIAHIHGLEESNAVRALVMELVEGEDLSTIVSRGAMPAMEAMPIARQIIDALEAAHDQGIIHRDLKPANVKVRPDGTVKVLDFGLAKALDPNASNATADAMNSPTLTARATQLGVILGTAAYMSPEQARGRAVDKRTDVWAFGCVLYEMLAGRRAFDGEDATEIISAVVKTEPDWNALSAAVPAHVRSVITRCLTKDRKARMPDLSVVRYMLDDTTVPAERPATSAAPPRRSARLWQAAAAGLLITTIAAGALWYRAINTAPPVARFTIAPPDDLMFTAGGRPGSTVPAISPDGRTVAFTAQDAAGKRLLFVRPIDGLVAQPLAGTDGAAFPFWSPDSRNLGYAVVGKLMKVAATGGLTSTICALSPGIVSRGGSWSPDGVVIFNNGPAPAPLYRAPAVGGGAATPMGTQRDDETGRQFPSFLPDGRHYLYSSSGSEEKSGVYVGVLDSDETKRVTASSSGAIYDQKSGKLLFVRQGTLMGQTFSLKTFEVSGEAFPVAEHVEASVVPGVVAFSLSDTGVLAYGIGAAAGADFQLTWIDRAGKVIRTVGPDAQYRGVSVSSDGQVAAHRHEGEGGDIWVTNAQDRTTRFTLDASQENSSPVWSPTGDRIAYGSTRNGKVGISVKTVNGNGTEERLFETTSRMALPFSWTADGASVLFILGSGAHTDLWIVPVAGDHKAAPLLQSSFSELHPQFSPDGKWLAYTSNETGSSEVYVQRASMAGGKALVSTGSGNAPRWRGDSRELYYVAGGKMWAVGVTTVANTFVPGTPVPLFEYNGATSAHLPHFTYAVSKDGQRFLISPRKSGAESAALQTPIVVVMNWLDGMKK